MRIVHLADIHIRNFKYFEEYRIAFDGFYRNIEIIQPDVIVIAGDMSHAKSTISGNFVKLFSEFLISIRETCKTAKIIILLGNHDFTFSDQDSVNPISSVLDLVKDNNTYLIRGTGNNIIIDNFKFTLFDCFDVGREVYFNFDKECEKYIDKDKVNILLYHGIVYGAKTGLGYTFDYGLPLQSISKFDYAFMGDIHSLQFLGVEKYSYAGSFLQQNFGESRSKGFLLWDIKDKDNFTNEFIEIPESTMFYDYKSLEEFENEIKTLEVYNKPKFKLTLDKELDSEKRAEIRSLLKNKFNATEVHFIVKNEKIETLEEVKTDILNVRDINVQSKLLTEYYEKHQDLDVDIRDVIELNKNTIVNSSQLEDVGYGKFDIISVDFKNFFSFGECNINFNELKNKVVGLFAPNKSGKSNLVQTILYLIYQSTTKNTNRSVEIINKYEKTAKGEILLKTYNGKYYKIILSLTRNKDGTTAKSELDFYETDTTGKKAVNEKEDNKRDTKKEIRKLFGNLDVTTLTTVSPQNKAALLFDKLPSARKDIFAQIFGLEVFDIKQRLNKPKHLELEHKLKELEKVDVIGNIEKIEKDIEKYNNLLNNKKTELKVNEMYELTTNNTLNTLSTEYKEISDIINTPNIDTLNVKLNNIKDKIKKNSNLIEINSKSSSDTIKEIELLNNKLSTQSLQKVTENITLCNEIENNIKLKRKDLSYINSQLININNRMKLKDETTCSSDVKLSCRLLEDSFKAALEMPQLTHNEGLIEKEIESLISDAISLNKPELLLIKEDLVRTAKVIEELNEALKKINNSTERCKLENDGLNKEIELLESKIDIINKNMEKISKKEFIENGITKCKDIIEKTNKIKFDLSNEISEININIGKCIFNRESNAHILDEVKKIKKEYNVYRYYDDAFSKHGIPYQIIVDNLNCINKEINRVISGLTDFNCYMENNNEDIEIFVQDNRGTRRIELCSGMETLIASLAIRTALTKVTPVPHPSLFIIDEGFGSLDNEYIANMNILLRNLKNIFNTILLITHVDNMKEHTDTCLELTNDSEGKTFISNKL